MFGYFAQCFLMARHGRSLVRRGRFCAVLGLCLMVMPAAGFWGGAADKGRGIHAIRIRINHGDSGGTAGAVPSRHSSLPVLARDAAASSLSLDRGRYRASLRDIAPEKLGAGPFAEGLRPSSRTMLSVSGNTVAVASGTAESSRANSIGDLRRSQEFLHWMSKGTALPQETTVAHVRQAAAMSFADTLWLAEANLPSTGECAAVGEVSLAADMHQLLVQLREAQITTLPLRAGLYMDYIRREASRFGLPPQLVYGIMRAESAFNPYAVSNAGALGLMQLVPDTAGNEVHTYLTGKSAVPSRSMLFDPVRNIEYGSAYLHLLATRYFSGVTNRASRELCMIAAYNAGPRAVMRVFASSGAEGIIASINELTPEQLFTRLSRHMAALETRLYIGKVLAAMNSYPG